MADFDSNLMPPSAMGFAVQPDQMVPKELYLSKEWNLQNARYIVSNYNNTVNAFGGLAVNGFIEGIPERWSERALSWETYYMGKQNNTAYSFMARDEKNQDLPIKLFTDQTIFSLIKHMEGELGTVVDSLPKIIGAHGISEDIVNSMTIKRNMAKWMMDNRDYVMELQAYGAMFPTEYQFRSQEDLDKYFAEDHKEYEEFLYECLAKDILYNNYWTEVFGYAMHDAMTTGFGMIRVYVQGGRVILKRVPPWMAIWDNAKDGKFNREARFAGEIYDMSVPQIIQRWGKKLTENEKFEIQEIARSDRAQGFLNSMLLPNTNITWWKPNINTLPTVVCADVEWLSLKPVEAGGSTQYIATRRKATLIGNKFIVDDGECDNIIEAEMNPSDTELSFKQVTPDMSLGYPIGVAERLHRLVDIRSMLMTKVLQLVSRSKGKNFVFKAQNMPEAMRAPDIIADLSRMGITVITTADPDKDDGQIDSRLGESVDLTLDPSIFKLIEISAYIKEEMEDVMNIPRGVRGNQKGFQSYKTAEFNKAQSTQGLSTFYDTIETFFLNVVRYAVETKKVMITIEPTFEDTLIIGDKGVEYITTETKGFSFAKCRIYAEFNDVVQDADREKIEAVALQAINSQQLEFIDWIRIQGMRSIRVIENYLEARMQARKREMAEQMQQQMALEDKKLAVNAQTQMGMAQMQVDGKLQDTAMREEGAMNREVMSLEAKGMEMSGQQQTE